MNTFAGWRWVHKQIPIEEKINPKNQIKVMEIRLINPKQYPINFADFCKEPVCLITGDGHTLQKDVAEFESWQIPHDLYCVNRSLLYFQRPVNHWAAVDCEEAVWFAENVNEAVKPDGHRILRHTIGILPYGFDCYWKAANWEEMLGYAKNIWQGNTAYLAMLTALYMGYKKVVLAGVPLDTGPHWYDPPGTEGPNWVGKMYRQWMDFKMSQNGSSNVRAMSGYSKFILGEATREWLQP